MLGFGGLRTSTKYGRGDQRARPNMERDLEKWLADAPQPRVRLATR